jgi:putative DNA primase/helicase
MRASAVEPRAVEWFWHPYLPYGKISVVAGQMGQAKSLLTAWLAAYATPRGVIVLSAEDDAEDTIRPRLEAVGADLNRVEILTDATLNAVELGEVCDELGDVALITVDPVSAYMAAGVNSWKSQDVRLALEPLRQLAATRRIAVVLIQHVNRRSDGDPLARIADSAGVPQLARSVMIWGPDPSDPEGDHGSHKVLTRAKGNLARNDGTSATFTIVERKVTGDILAPALIQGDDAHIAADDVIADQETRTARDEASEWLRDLLAGGPVASKDVLRQAREQGIAEKTLRRAGKGLGVINESVRNGDKITGWQWSLPAYNSDHVGHIGHLGHVGKVANLPNVPNIANTELADQQRAEALFERHVEQAA